MKIKIVRTSVNSNSITGELYVDDKYICQTLELPYKDNKSSISSIPLGNYGGILRYDHKDHWRIELTETEPRKYIQIHTGNSPKDIQGCILVGEKVDIEKNQITNSILAYTRLKEAFYGTTEPNSTPNTEITIEIQEGLGPIPKDPPLTNAQLLK
jgi:hypothetical protein